MSNTPFLSILVPAYNYSQGLERILNALSPLPEDIEVLVFDDSHSNNLKKIVDKFTQSISNLRYQHNAQLKCTSFGAANNWNLLLDAANGEYVLLMHHDEFPLGLNFISSLRSILTVRPPPDVVLLDLLILDESLQYLPRHAPKFMRWLITQYAPGYLFRRNVIGPTATLVLRRSVTPRFNPALRWLVDVDFYVRLSRARLQWAHAFSIQICSVKRKTGSITNKLAHDLSRIDIEERKELVKCYMQDRIWLGVGAFGISICMLELFFWALVRGVLIFFDQLPKLLKGK
jgi:glycosyltransferase involved in cell wall biosynthesis